MLVSLAQASEHLRRDTSDDDQDLILKIEAASAAVLNYLKDDVDFLDSAGEVDIDSAGDPIGVPKEVQISTLILTGIFYRDRDGKESANLQLGYLPMAVTSILYPLRTPALG